MATVRRGLILLLSVLVLSAHAAPARARTANRGMRSPSWWERDWAAILLVLGVTLAQSALIGRLLLERRKRICAQRSVESQIAYEHMLAALRTDAVQHFPEEAPPALEYAIAHIGRYTDASSATLVVHPDHLDQPTATFRWTRAKPRSASSTGVDTGADANIELPLVFEHALVGTLTLIGAGIDCRGGAMRVRIQIAARLIAVALARARASRALAESRGQVAHLGRLGVMSQLNSVMSHELRQPLTAIRYNAQAGARLLKQNPPDVTEVRTVLGEIVAEIGRATELVEHIRMMVRNQEQGRTSVFVNDVCRDAMKLLEREARAKGVAVDITLMGGLPAVHGDAVQLQQVVLNLALNAIESAATSEGDRRVVLCTAGRANGVELEVRDSGPGLPPQVQQHLFESYFSTKGSRGLGMGLAIVHQIIEAHNGQVSAENHPNGGAVFRVTLPTVESRLPGVGDHPDRALARMEKATAP